MNQMYKTLIILSFSLFCSISAKSQQIPRYSQYIMNEFIVNPAVAGADGLTTLNLTGRKDWLGFGGGIPTPESYSVSIQARIQKHSLYVKRGASKNKLFRSTKGKVGLGGLLINDYNGAIQRTGLAGVYSYHIRIQASQLSFGFSCSLTQMRLRSKYLNFQNNTDESMLALANSSIWIPDFGAGINYMTPNFHIGFSIAQLLESQFAFGNATVNFASSNIHLKRNYFLLAAYKNEFSSNSEWEFEPSVLFKMNDPVKITKSFTGPQFQADIMLRMIYQESYWFGASYRTSNEFIVMGGVKFQNYYFSYSFDYGTNSISRYSYGSHEISISARFGDTSTKYKWLDRY